MHVGRLQAVTFYPKARLLACCPNHVRILFPLIAAELSRARHQGVDGLDAVQAMAAVGLVCRWCVCICVCV